MSNQEPKKIEIALPEELARGTYSNLAIVAHSTSEVILDFISVMPNTPKHKVCSRIVMTPENAKRLLLALQKNIAEYENAFGRIDLNKGNTYIPPMFGGAEA